MRIDYLCTKIANIDLPVLKCYTLLLNYVDWIKVLIDKVTPMTLLLRIIFLTGILVSTALASPRFLTISDIHYGDRNSSLDGHDTGKELMAITLDKYKELSQNVDFILTLGDLPTHLLGYSPEKELYEQVVFHGLFEGDSLKKPLFYISGNNDPISGNYQPFEFNGKSPLNYADDWSGAACVHCDGLIIDDTNMHTGGYYSSYVIPGNEDVVLIVLNTTQWMKPPRFLPKYPNQDKDAMAQLAWFADQLEANQAKQLLIAMHEPPGKDYTGSVLWQDKYLAEFIRLLDENHDAYEQISLLTSHTHMDELRKIQLTDGTTIYGYSTPSISRVHYNNSAMKIFDLDTNMAIQDFTTYYTPSTQYWHDDEYHALGVPGSIFPKCQKQNLAQCLDSLTPQQVCDAVELGQFYGAKSTRVNNTQCRKVFKI